MAKEEAYAQWLLATKRFVGETQEWKTFSKELQASVEHHLSDNHVPSFVDLSPNERLIFIDKAAKAIQAGSSYKKLYSQVSLTLDQQINNSVAKQLLTEEGPLESTKTESVMDHMRDGAVSILKRWPEMKTKLRMCLNMPIPEKLQSVAWTLFLSDAKVRKEYLSHLMNRPRKAISQKDQMITEMCEQILKIQNTFEDIGPPSVGAFYAMKAVLSYFHAQQTSGSELHHVFYLLILPMLQVLSPYISKTQPAANNIVTVLVEMYLAFIRDRPNYIADINDEYVKERREFTKKVAQCLIDNDTKYNRNLTGHITSLVINKQPGQQSTNPSESPALLSVLTDTLLGVVSSLIKSLFVGFLNKKLLMFVWDQYIIGLDVPGYHMQFLSAFTASLLIVLRNDIFQCTSEAELVSIIQRECHKIDVNQIQQKIKDEHFKDLHNALIQEEKAAVSVVDPTRVTEKSWTHWNNELIPNRLGVDQRQIARNARQAERRRLLTLRREKEAKESLLSKQLLVDETLEHNTKLEQQRLNDEKAKLEDELHFERQQRQAKDQMYEFELSRLRREIDEIKRIQLKPVSAGTRQSFTSALAPPPSRVSIIPSLHQLPPVVKIREPPIAPNADTEAEKIITDLITIVSKKFTIMSHGEGTDNQKLNKASKDDINEHKDDVRQAELKVFGRNLKPGEFDKMETEERNKKSDEMMEVIRKRLEDCRVEQLERNQI